MPTATRNRPGSSARRGAPLMGGKPPGTASGRPPGTATRLTTGMAPGTAMRGAMPPGAGGVSLNAQINVTDRPMTQQGLGGMKTGSKGPQRQVQDKSYFMGQLRAKITELNTENIRMRKELEQTNEENNSFLTYEKRAEQLANEIKMFQGELGDYNTLVDKLNTEDDISDVQRDYEELRAQNEREAKTIDNLFGQKQEQEAQIRELDIELEQQKQLAGTLVANMSPEMREKYKKLKSTNDELLHTLELAQQEVDALNLKRDNLEEELSMSQIKQEAVRLYQQIHELEVKKESLTEETQSRGTPQEEREKLLKQVKEDNMEIASMEKHLNEIRDKCNQYQEDLRNLELDIEENQGEKNQKYKELKKREETMNEFLETFDETKNNEVDSVAQLEGNIVAILEHTSRNMSRFQHLPSPEELATMKDDLQFKANEMKKSEATASGLGGESDKLRQDLEKVEQLESKITGELDVLKSRIDTMEQELVTYNDLDTLKAEAEAKKEKLKEERVTLQKRRDTFKKEMQALTQQYEALKAQLNDNETHAQLGNLERKWQHHEQNNFVMKEFIATKTMESDFRPLQKKMFAMVEDYNKMIQNRMSGKLQ